MDIANVDIANIIFGVWLMSSLFANSQNGAKAHFTVFSLYASIFKYNLQGNFILISAMII